VAVTNYRSSGQGATLWQSGALGRGIRAEQGEFQKTLLGFYECSILEGSVAWGCRTSRGSQSSSSELCEWHKPCMKTLPTCS
jgi:hypothetical protein